jgi:hypothetical protein
MTLFERVHMPSFAGATEWLNSEPLGPAELPGQQAGWRQQNQRGPAADHAGPGRGAACAHSRDADVSEVQEARPPGFDGPAQERSYFARASFSDPNGNRWVLQEITTRLAGREWED